MSCPEAAAFGDDFARLNEAVRRLASLCMIGISAWRSAAQIDGLTRELSGSRLKQDKRADELPPQVVSPTSCVMPKPIRIRTPDDLNALEVEKR